MKKRALITGVGGQDGYFLAKLLQEKQYEVFGISRNALHPLFPSDNVVYSGVSVRQGSILDKNFLEQVLSDVEPNEIYHFAAQSNVGKSYSLVDETYKVNILGSMQLFTLAQKIVPNTKIYNSGSSEMFGDSEVSPQNESTPFRPKSPYGISKVAAFYSAQHQKNSFGQFIATGITYNHESERRDIAFVTQKICRGLLGILKGMKAPLFLGNLESIRDWGFAGDYVQAMWELLQLDSPVDAVIATGVGTTIEQFTTLVAGSLGIDLVWSGNGITRHALWNGKKVVAVSPEYFRPSETVPLIGDPRLLTRLTGWKPQVALRELVERMLTIKNEIDL